MSIKNMKKVEDLSKQDIKRSKSMAKKYKNMYGVHFLDGRKEPNVIFYTWKEEQEATFHVPHMMYGFETEEEANNWFDSITVEKEKKHIKFVKGQKRKKASTKTKNENLNNGNHMTGEPKKETKPKGRPPVNTETKKRVSLAVLPSLYEKVGKIAYVERLSISEITSRLLEEYVADNEDKIKEYDNLENMKNMVRKKEIRPE